MSKSENVPIMAQAIPAGFDPMKLLRKAVSAINGEPVLRLELPYKKLWFRKSHPNGRIYVKPLQLNEKIAIYEAQVFLNRDDNVPFVSYTASVANEGTPDGKYAEKAQNEAVDNALSDAGFGIQIADRYYGSEVPVSAYPGTAPKAVRKVVQATAKTVVQPPAVAEQAVPAPQVKTEVSTAQPAAQTGVQTVTKAEPVVVTKAEPVVAPKVEPIVTPEVEAKAEPIAQEVPAVKAEPAQSVIAPEVKPAPEAHAANAALELLRGGSAQPAEAKAASAEKDAFSDLPFTFGPTYTNEMSVEQIVGIMTLEQAKAVVVDDGMSKGMTMGEVAEKRPASLQFYLSVGYKKNNNILKAAAQILLNERKKAS